MRRVATSGLIAATLLAITGGVALAATGVLPGTGGGDPAPLTQPAASAGTLTSSALPVSRRSDPSVDRYTFSARPRTAASRLTDAQRWFSTHARPFVAHDSDPRLSLFLTGWTDGPPVTAYANATGVNVGNPAKLREARRWLVSSKGRPVFVDGWRMLDVRNPAARRWWLVGGDGRVSCTRDRDRRGALDLLACGYDGLWVDNVLTDPPQWFKPNPHLDRAAWGAGVVALLRELRAAMPAGKTFTINAHWTDTTFPYAATPALDARAPLVQAAALADQLVIEGGAIDGGIDYAGPVTAAWSYPRLLAYADALHAAGARIQWEKVGDEGLTSNATAQLGALPSCRDESYQRQPGWRQGSAAWRGHVRTAGFNLATALLTAVPGDGVGDMCEYPGRGFVGYGVDLGAPTGARSTAGPLTVRAFERGYVAVNPTMADSPLTLPDGHTGVDVASRSSEAPPAPTSTFTLPPRTAAIVRYG